MNVAILLTFALIVVVFSSIELPFQQQRLATVMEKVQVLLHAIMERERDRLANELFEGRLSGINLRTRDMLKLKGLLAIMVYDRAGKLLVANGDNQDLSPLSHADMEMVGQGVQVRQITINGEETLNYLQAIRAIGERIGFVRMFYSLADVERERHLSMVLYVSLLTSILLVMLILLNWLLRKNIIAPISGLVGTMEAVSEGDLTCRFAVESADEIGRLGKAFNSMTDSLLDKQRSLQKAEEKYRNLFENALEGIFQISTEGRILSVNRSMAQIFGFPSAEEMIASVIDIENQCYVDPEDRRRLTAQLREKSNVVGVEIRFRSRDGKIFWGAVSARAVFDPLGLMVGYEGFLVDVTESKAKEQAERQRQAAEAASQAKSDFLANMSHEIRTPMNAIMGLSHLVMKTDLSPKQQDYHRKIQSASRSLLGLINNILDISKIEAGRMELESTPFFLSKVVDNIGNLLVLKAEEKGLAVSFHRGEGVPDALIGDPLRLEQVLLNLANNAVKFTKRGVISLSTEVVERANSRAVLRFVVRDTGIGLDEEHRSKLFKPFSQADSSTTRLYGGTGLGLAISKRIVDLMGGEFHVESAPDQGSAFSFTAAFGLQQEKDIYSQAIPTALRGLRVLVADDDQDTQELLLRTLRPLAFEVAAVGSGQALLLELEKTITGKTPPIDLVILDWKMPGLDGLETARQIKTNPRLARVPAIFLLTAYGREELMAQTDSVGLDAFLVKPVDVSLLVNTIVEVFRGKTDIPGAVRRLSPPESCARAPLQGARILVAEDNEINQQVIREILEYAGVEVSIASNGRQAMEMLAAQGEYHAVLMDIQMPEMDGYETTRGIREVMGRKDLPIIAMTAHALVSERVRCLDAGMNDHLAKPVDPDQVFATLAKWIKLEPDKERATVSPRCVAKNEVAIVLPDSLPGVDLPAALRRIGGDSTLLLQLLKIFRRDYLHAAEDVRRALEQDERLAAQKILHSLKGVAGNISATALAEAAAALESALTSQARAGLTPLVETLEERLAEVLQSALALERQHAAPPRPAVEFVQPDRAHLSALLTAFDELMDRGRLSSRDHFLEIKELLAGGAYQDALDQIETHLDIFDFDGARLALKPLALALAAPLDSPGSCPASPLP